jgi:hypothetical protein
MHINKTIQSIVACPANKIMAGLKMKAWHIYLFLQKF